MTVQASSQICPSKINDDDFNYDSDVAVCTLFDNSVERGRSFFCEGVTISISGRVNDGPE